MMNTYHLKPKKCDEHKLLNILWQTNANIQRSKPAEPLLFRKYNFKTSNVIDTARAFPLNLSFSLPIDTSLFSTLLHIGYSMTPLIVLIRSSFIPLIVLIELQLY